MVEGNSIGTNAAGTGKLANGGTGIAIFSGPSNNTVGGASAGARNVISGNAGQGITISGSVGNWVEGNYIGTTAAGNAALGNGANGIYMPIAAQNNTIGVGSDGSGAGNVISGNAGSGILIHGSPTFGNLVAGNYIGTDASGTQALGNTQAGVAIYAGPTNNTIGGTTAAACNLIDASGQGGVDIFSSGTNANVVEGNYIGLDVSGQNALGNAEAGVAVFGGAQNNAIGDVVSGAGNVITGSTSASGFSGAGVLLSNNGFGITSNGTTTGNTIAGNFIGTDDTGTAAIPNVIGVQVQNASGNTVGGTATGANNVIAYNQAYGVEVDSGNGTTIQGNSIHDNGGLGIDLNGAANNGQASPMLSSATAAGTTVSGALAGTPSTTFALDFYANATSTSGQGQYYLGSTTVTTDGTGQASFTATGLTALPVGTGYLTATATDPTGDTSEFSADLKVPPIAHVAANLTAAIAVDTAYLTLSATDLTPNETFSFLLSWGDGQQTTVNAGTTTVAHQYSQDRAYTITVTAIDGDGAASQPISALFVASNSAGDQITLSGGTSAGQVQLQVNNEPADNGTYSPTDLVYVSGQGGGDTYTVNFGSTLTIPIAITGGGSSSNDTLVVNGDHNSPNVINKTAGQVTWGSPATETIFRVGVPNTTINANGTSQNYVNDPGGNTIINGGPGTNNITITATSGTGVVINGGPGANTYTIDLGHLAAPVSIQNTAATAVNNLVVNGASGDNTIAVTGSQVTEGAQTINLAVPLASLTVNGGTGNNQITVANPTIPVQSLVLNSGGTSNTITLINTGADVGSLVIGGTGTAGTNQVVVQGSLPANVQVPQIAPVVMAGASASLVAGGLFTQAGSFIDGGSAETFTATVNYGDGSVTQPLALNSDHTFSLSHTYANPGTFTVTVIVSDNQDDTGTASLTVTVNQDQTSTAIASSANSLVYGQSVTITATVTSNGPSTATPAGTVQFQINGSNYGSPVPLTSGMAGVNFIPRATGTYTVTTDYSGASLFLASAGGPLTQTVAPAPLSATGRTISALTGFSFTGVVASFANADPFGGTASYMASITWGDGGTSSGTISVDPSGAFDVHGTHTYAVAGTFPLSVTITHVLGYSTPAAASGTAIVVENTGLLLLDPSGQGALTASGNAGVVLSNGGAIDVDSSNAASVLASGNATLMATEFDLHGSPGYQTTANARLQGTITSGVSLSALSMQVPSDLASLPVPAAATNPISANYGGQISANLQPGTYAAIHVSGNAQVTLAPGVYYLQGGFSMSGNAQVAGQDVLLYLAGGSSLNLSGNARLTLTPPVGDAYQGVVLFGTRTGTVPLTLSGNAGFIFSGTIYAAASAITVSGNAMLQGFNAEVIAADLSDAGNGSVQIQANAFNRQLPLGDILLMSTGTSSTGSFSVGSNADPSVTDLALLSLMERWATTGLAANDDALGQLLCTLATHKQANALGGGVIDILFSGGW